MLGALIGIVLWLVVLGVCWWCVQQLLALVPLGEPFATLVRIVIVLIAVIIVIWAIIAILGILGVNVPSPLHLNAK